MAIHMQTLDKGDESGGAVPLPRLLKRCHSIFEILLKMMVIVTHSVYACVCGSQLESNTSNKSAQIRSFHNFINLSKFSFFKKDTQRVHHIRYISRKIVTSTKEGSNNLT
jgi:hypothetical protein